jgi:hypothetical protein
MKRNSAISKIRIIMDTKLMLQSVNGSKPGVVRNKLLMLRSIDMVRQGLSGMGY